jgi:hypothetical protein
MKIYSINIKNLHAKKIRINIKKANMVLDRTFELLIDKMNEWILIKSACSTRIHTVSLTLLLLNYLIYLSKNYCEHQLSIAILTMILGAHT